ncbi:MAG: hypothetical protein O2898_10725 [Proteobacteria bacterium]|nr:hypothetical protein [Pseudomonadota bacterium]
MTCCYCGTRAALVLDRGRHELACSSCGAPLHDMKMLRRDPAPPPRHAAPPAKPKPVKVKAKPVKRRKGLLRKVFEEAIDVIEDIFD